MGELITSSQPVTRKTCRRRNDPGHAHALTFSCFRRQPFLASDRTHRWMLDAIALAVEKHELDLWSFVIMPEHVHLLIRPTRPDYNISRILSTLKQPISKRAIHHARTSAPALLPRMEDSQPNGKCSLRFWQRGGGFDRNLSSPRYIWETIDYFHANPVRRGLCDSDTDWPWSSARVYHGRGEGLLPIGFETLPADPR